MNNFLIFLSDFFSSNFPNQSYIVGGFNRDTLLGLQPKDIDIVIEKENGAEEACNTLTQLFPDKVSYYKVGQSYPIFKVYFEEYDETIDIADTQTEYYPDSSSRQRETVFASLEEDAKRRDFSINKIYYDFTTHKYIDFGNGLIDLEMGMLNLSDNDPNIMFDNDPLRIIRLYRFAVKYDFYIHQDLQKASIDNLHRLECVSKERIHEELMKICDCPKGLVKLYDKAPFLFEYLFPWVVESKSILQHPDENTYDVRNIHLEGQYVWNHIEACLRAMPEHYRALTQLSVLFHDIGKLRTRSVKNGKCQFINHQYVGIDMAKEELKRMKFHNGEIDVIISCIKYHMDLHTLHTDESIIKFIRKVGLHLDFILKVGSMDSFGNHMEKETDLGLFKLTRRIYEIKDRMKEPYIKGNDIMKIFNCKSDENVGRVKQACLWLQDNRNMDREQLLSKLSNFNNCGQFLSKYKN